MAVKKIYFKTPTTISLYDITSMGDSVKRNDPTTIGVFDSGLKYTIALLLRNNIYFGIYVKGESMYHDYPTDWWEESITSYTFGTYDVECYTGKTKKLISVDETTAYMGGECMSQHDMREPSMPETHTHKTGFAVQLGYNWELWMALRELYSNMIDEGGHIIDSFHPEDGMEENGTIMELIFDEDNPFNEIWKNRHLYINETAPLYVVSDSLEVLANPESYLRIYKQNILVYQDETKPSTYAYNIKFGEIDERRILSQLSSVECRIASEIFNTKNEAFLREIITGDFKVRDGEFLKNCQMYSTASDLTHKIATEVYEALGDVKSYDWIITSIKKRKDCKIGGKIIQSISDSIWSFSGDVKVESEPEPIHNDLTGLDDNQYDGEHLTPTVLVKDKFLLDIERLYNFNLDVVVNRAKLVGSKAIADKYNNAIIIDETFDVEQDFHDFMIQYVDLKMKGNVVTNLGKYIVNLIKK